MSKKKLSDVLEIALRDLGMVEQDYKYLARKSCAACAVIALRETSWFLISAFCSDASPDDYHKLRALHFLKQGQIETAVLVARLSMSPGIPKTRDVPDRAENPEGWRQAMYKILWDLREGGL